LKNDSDPLLTERSKR